jgi:hypothetical protein
MPQIGWFVASICLIAAVLFLWLWIQARLGRRAAEETLLDLQHALNERDRHQSGEFRANVIYKLLAKGQIQTDGQLRNFGVSQPDNRAPEPFFNAVNMDALQAGDAFSVINGALHKVDTGPAAAPAPAPAPAAASPPTPAPLAAVAGDDDDDDISERTIMFAPSRGAEKPKDDPYVGFPYLLVTSGPDAGTRFALPYTSATIGREQSNIIALSDQGSSRLHCEIQYRRHEFVLRDNNSTNGTICNGKKVEEQALTFGDSIQVADSVMTFSCDGWEYKDSEPNKAIASFETCLEKEPNFILALQHLAFLLERNVARKKEAEPLWKRITDIDQGR